MSNDFIYSIQYHLLFIVVALIAALICLYYSFRYLKLARNLEDIPPSKIRSAAQGYVEINGFAQYLTSVPLKAKFSQQSCVWYHSMMDEWREERTQEGTRAYWQEIESEQSFDPFLIEDGTGQCVIMPEGAEILVSHSNIWYGNTLQPGKLNVKPSFWTWFFGNFSRYRYREFRLEINDPLHVSGTFASITTEDPSIKKYPQLKEYAEEQNKNSVDLLMKSDSPQKFVFLVSSLDEKRIIRKYRLNAFIFFAAFLFFCAAMVSNFIHHLY